MSYEQVGDAMLYQDDDKRWTAVLCFKEDQVDLDGEYDTAGQALDALMQWAKGRRLYIATGLMPIRKLTAAPGSFAATPTGHHQ